MSRLQDKERDALAAVSQLLDFWRTRRIGSYESAFGEIRDLLVANEFESAWKRYGAIPKPNMGGLFDLCVSPFNGHLSDDVETDDILLRIHIANVSTSLENLRLFMEEEIDRPLLEPTPESSLKMAVASREAQRKNRYWPSPNG